MCKCEYVYIAFFFRSKSPFKSFRDHTVMKWTVKEPGEADEERQL